MSSTNSSSEPENFAIEGSGGGPFVVDRIVGIYIGEKDKKRYYRVKWTDTWEPEENLSEACNVLIDDFWKGRTLDPHGKEVTQADLRAGLRVIKMEQSATSNEPATHVVSSTVTSESSLQQKQKDTVKKYEKVEKINQEAHQVAVNKSPSLVLPTATEATVDVSDIKKQIMSPTDKSPPHNDDTAKKPLSPKPATPTKSPPVEQPPAQTTVECSTQTSELCIEGSNDEVVTQTSNECVPYMDVNNVHHSPPPCFTELEDMLSSQDGGTATNQIAELIEVTDDIIDLSDDDLEIVGAFNTPKRRKRGRPPSNSAVKSICTPPTQHTFAHLSQTNPETRAPRVLNNSTRGHVTPLHPRRLLRFSSQESDGDECILPRRVHQQVDHHRQQYPSTHQQKQHHKILTGRTCNICKETFDNLTIARQHANSAHSQGNVCAICHGVFRNLRELNSHMFLHTNDDVHKCEVCFMSFKQSSALSQHLSRHETCNICKKRFLQRSNLLQHMSQHENCALSNLTCRRCLAVFNCPEKYSAHMRSHEETLTFQCTTCKERFHQKSDLLLHLEGHNDGRPYFCHVCKKSFQTQTFFYRHVQIHKTRNEA